jgi:hypothetical protein
MRYPMLQRYSPIRAAVWHALETRPRSAVALVCLLSTTRTHQSHQDHTLAMAHPAGLTSAAGAMARRRLLQIECKLKEVIVT